MKFEDQININIALLNNSPVEDFLNLSPNQLDAILYNTFSEDSPIHFEDNIDNDTLNKIPLFRILETYLRIIDREKQIKLTPLGALPKKVVVELYNHRFLLDEFIEAEIIKISREHDCISILSARLTTEIAGLVKKSNNKLTLTKKGLKLLAESNRRELFITFFQAFTSKFLWSYNDSFPDDRAGQLGWAFSVILLHKFGHETQTVEFYASKYLRAFPAFLGFFNNDYTTPEEQFIDCYSARTFDRFLFWFGLVTLNKAKPYHSKTDDVENTGVFYKIFKFDGVG